MEHGSSERRIVSPRLKVGSAMPATLSRQLHNGISGRWRAQHHYADSQRTTGCHPRKRGSEFRDLRILLHSRQKRGEGPKRFAMELHVAAGCCKIDDHQHPHTMFGRRDRTQASKVRHLARRFGLVLREEGRGQ